jgi:serine/threonine-protein kinase
MLSKGQKINGRYEIIKSIGEGGMANVYLAQDIILNRQVAIKVLRGDLANDDKFIRRFQREAKSVSDLSHPNIVEVYDVGCEEGQHYIVMEYIDGRTLKQLIHKRGSLTVPEVVDIMTQLTDGLAHAHEAYIIHRDIKPQNIMILDNGIIKITDFGIAMTMNATQLTQTNSVMGSVHYLPPEQAAGKSATVKSDIYSAGILMYELLTGSVPFKGDNAVEIALKQMKEKLPSVRKQNPLIPQSVENILIKATAKNPKNRYDTVREMHDDLVKCLDNPDESKYIYSYPENDSEASKSVPVLEAGNQGKVMVPDTDEEIEEATTGKKKKGKKKKVFLISGIVVGSVIALAIIFLIVFRATDSKEVKVPDVTGMSLEEAVKLVEKKGLKYTTEDEASDEVEENYVISTKPKAGSTRKKGATITIIVSTGSETYLLEDLTGQDYRDVKAMLTLKGIEVNVEKKTVDNPSDYIDKEDAIIGQSPSYKEGEEVRLKKGDVITLYIPDVVNTYPDMVAEEWTLDDAKAFAEEYEINLDVTEEETNDYEEGRVIYQNRSAGSTIVKGITLKIRVAKAKSKKYNVYVNYYKDGTTEAVENTLTYKTDLDVGTSGNYKCPAKAGYSLTTTGTLTYTISDEDVYLICYYSE